MPYKDPEKKRQRDRERQKARRHAQGDSSPTVLVVPSDFRLETARDALALLAEEVTRMRNSTTASDAEKARTIGYLVGIALRAVETGGMEARIEALEATIQAVMRGKAA